MLLTLSDAGRQFLASAWASRRAWLDRSLADWPAEDRRVLNDLIERLAGCLARAPSSAPGDGHQQGADAHE